MKQLSWNIWVDPLSQESLQKEGREQKKESPLGNEWSSICSAMLWRWKGEPQTEECRQPLEADKDGKGTDSLSELPEEVSPADTSALV
jgi:hypothetical protein